MKRLIPYYKSNLFHFKWLGMSSEARYAYLWAKTRKLIDMDYSVRNVSTNTDIYHEVKVNVSSRNITC